MRFPLSDRLALTCSFERYVPGALHPDGRRYLPTIVLRCESVHSPDLPTFLLGVTDRHHVVDPDHIGQRGAARLVFLLSTIHLQTDPARTGLIAEPGISPHSASTTPTAFGHVTVVPAWETQSGRLPYESLFTEFVLDIGYGLVGVRTSFTAANIATALGTPQLAPGDPVVIRRSRIDILAFNPLTRGARHT